MSIEPNDEVDYKRDLEKMRKLATGQFGVPISILAGFPECSKEMARKKGQRYEICSNDCSFALEDCIKHTTLFDRVIMGKRCEDMFNKCREDCRDNIMAKK
jgi:hypothetical protein